MSLATLQHALQAHILHGHDDIAAHVLSSPYGSVVQRLNIYREGYRLRLLEVMHDHFSHSARYLGDEWFDSEARQYIDAHPSDSPSLRPYGQHWPAWLAQRYPQDLDMADLATLEWALRSAFDAADASPLTMTDLAAIEPAAWAHIGFGLMPGLQWLPLSHDVLPLWHALAEQTEPPPLVAKPLTVLVWRQGWQPHFRSIGQGETAALQALGQGQSFAQVCAQIPSDGEADATTQAGHWLQRWVAEGLIRAAAA